MKDFLSCFYYDIVMTYCNEHHLFFQLHNLVKHKCYKKMIKLSHFKKYILPFLSILLALVFLGMLTILLSGGINLRPHGIPLAIHRIQKPLVLYSVLLFCVLIASLLRNETVNILHLFRIVNESNPVDKSHSVTIIEAFVICGAWLFLISGFVTETLTIMGKLTSNLAGIIIAIVCFPLCLWHLSTLLPLLRSNFSEKSWRKNTLIDAAVIVLVILTYLIIYSPAFPWIRGGRDPGVYLNSANLTSRSGNHRFKDILLAELPTTEKSLFYGTSSDNILPKSWLEVLQFFGHEKEYGHYGTLFPGFHISDAESGLVTPQFFPFYTSLMAFSIQLVGFFKGIELTPLLAAFSLLFLFFFLRTALSPLIGCISIVLLGLNMGQFWYAKTPNTEISVQLLFFMGLYAITRYRQFQKMAWLIMASFAFGEMTLVRIDTYLVLPFVFVLLYFTFSFRKWKLVIFWFLLIGIICYSLFIALNVNTVYLHDVSKSVLTYSHITKAFFLFCLIVIIILGKWKQKSIGELLIIIRPLIPLLSLFLFLVVVLYFNLVLPFGHTVESDFLNFEKLLWYVPPFMMICGLLGLCLLNLRFSNLTIFLFLSMCYLYSLYYLHDDHIFNDQFFWFRRFLTFTLPLLVVGAAYFISRLGQCGRALKIMSLGLLGLFILQSMQDHQFLWYEAEQTGLYSDLEEVAKKTTENDIIVLPHSNYGIETPLQFIFNRSVLTEPFSKQRTLNEREIIKKRFIYWQDHGKQVYFFLPLGHYLLSDPLFHFTNVSRLPIRYLEVVRTEHSLPYQIVKREKGFILVRFEQEQQREMFKDEIFSLADSRLL